MEYLINRLEKYAILKNDFTFDISINEMVYYFKDKSMMKDSEWSTIKTEIENLKYVYQLMNHYNYTFKKNYYDLLIKFVKELDTSLQTYLVTIDWLNNAKKYDEECKNILKNSEKIQTSTFYTEQLMHVINSYDIMVPIIEEIRMNIFNNTVEKNMDTVCCPNPRKKIKM
jgi:hypothetical protein